MSNRLYVGNLTFSATDAEITGHFSQAGLVTKVQIVLDRETGRSRGFAFVDMSTPEEAQNAIAQLNSQEFQGRKLLVNEARPREARPAGSRPPDRGGRPSGGGGQPDWGEGGDRGGHGDRGGRGDRGKRWDRGERGGRGGSYDNY